MSRPFMFNLSSVNDGLTIPSSQNLPSSLLPGSREEYIHPIENMRNQLNQIKKGCSIIVDKDQFQVNIDVQQFKPNEISVNVFNNTVTVEGKHEEQRDEHGFISRHFIRRYELPQGCDFLKVESKLSSDGVLIVTAPKKPDGKEVPHQHISIIMTGPLRNVDVEQNPKDGKPKNKFENNQN